MPEDSADRAVAIVSGGGSLPLEVAECAASNGFSPTIFAISDQFDGADDQRFPLVSFGLGQVDLLRRKLAEHGIRHLVMCGTVSRPDLSSLAWDLGALKVMPRIVKASVLGDDGALKTLVGILADWDLEVLGPTDVAPQLIASDGALSRRKLNKEAKAEAALGFSCLHRLDDLDVGQSAVVVGQRVVAIEAAEGTDAMLARVANLKQAGRLPSRKACGVLVKTAKPSQDLRLDIPVVGPDTVRAAAAASLNAIVLGSGKVLLADRAAALQLADQASIAVHGDSESQLQGTQQ
jgi:DUF1009 family protein